MVTESDRRQLMRGRYLAQNPLLAAWLGLGDAWGRLTQPRPPSRPATDRIRRIVVGLNGHVGDGLISLWPLARLRATFPDAHLIGLGPTALEAMLKPAGILDGYVPVDHWRINRSRISRAQKFRLYRRQRAEAVARLRTEAADAAVDLYFHYPNHARVLAEARIPIRLGFASGGGGPWYTHAHEFRDAPVQAAELQTGLVVALGQLAGKSIGDARPNYAVAGTAHLDLPASYVLLHPGTGAPQREWPEQNWRSLVGLLAAKGVSLVLTGAGPREEERNRALAALAPRALDLTGKLSWLQLAGVVKGASAVIGVESMMGHLAALFQRPTVSLYAGINRLERWRPYGTTSQALLHAVPCHPCNRSEGCAGMECVRGIEVAAVLQAVEKSLEGGASS